jgi:hypothetical protein
MTTVDEDQVLELADLMVDPNVGPMSDPWADAAEERLHLTLARRLLASGRVEVHRD